MLRLAQHLEETEMGLVYSLMSMEGLCTMSVKITIIWVEIGVRQKLNQVTNLTSGGTAIVAALPHPFARHMEETKMGLAYSHTSMGGLCTTSVAITTILAHNGVQPRSKEMENLTNGGTAVVVVMLQLLHQLLPLLQVQVKTTPQSFQCICKQNHSNHFKCSF